VRIGIVTPAFNAAAWIADAIRSVLAQSHHGWTMVVVDDGSTDATAAIVGGFADAGIRLIRQANAGVSVARNRGIAAFLGSDLAVTTEDAGDSLLFLDADDRLAPDALSRLAAALDRSPGAVAAVGGYTIAGRRGIRRPPSGDLLDRLLVRNLFANGGHLLLRRSAVRAAGNFRAGLVYGEDWEYWVRLALQGQFVAASGRDPVLVVRQHANGAYHRLACNPSAFAPCMEAIFSNPMLIACVGPRHLAAIRSRTDAENRWIIGRELIRHGRRSEGRAWLRRSIVGNPSLRRCVLAAVTMLPLLPVALRGPFQPYRVS
jgi:glycosyltransferase involved in cell wall biosynthesis